MSRADLTRDACTFARAAELLGDPWTLLALRELFLGTRRFDDWFANPRSTGVIGDCNRAVIVDRPRFPMHWNLNKKTDQHYI